MPVERFPPEFEDLLSREGRRVLAGTHRLVGALADPRRRFLSNGCLLSHSRIDRLRRLLDRALYDSLETIDRPIPPDSIWQMRRDYSETLPKTARVLTAYLESRREKAWRPAERIGLIAMLRSESFVAFATALAGRKLARNHGLQVLCYRQGDYSGPHNDHHPENRAARRGYIDMHVGFAGPRVAHQFLVYAQAGHLSQSVAVAGPEVGATISAYRLPFWHYTTPLVGKPGAARWVLLGTFLYR